MSKVLSMCAYVHMYVYIYTYVCTSRYTHTYGGLNNNISEVMCLALATKTKRLTLSLIFLFFSFLFFLGGFFFCIHDLRMNSVVKRNATDTSGMQSNHCFCQGVQVHVRMCLSAKQLKSLHGRLKQWKHWLWLSRRSQHPAEVISIPMDTQGLALRIHLTRCYLKSRNTANLSQ